MRRALAALALLLGVGAAVAGARPPLPEPIAPRELAQAIRDRRPGLTVVDLRGASAFAADALPTAVDAPPSGPTPPGAQVVLYGPEPHVRRAADLLRTRGVNDVRRLADGVGGWNAEVLGPVLPPDPARWTPGQQAAAELSAYFGGAPRTSAKSPAPEPTQRRGC